MPNSIAFYPTDFTAKDKIIDYLDAWNNSHEESQQVTYTDTVGLMMGMIQTMLNAVTYVLVAFTAISLIVSSVMIGVITYVSVVERTKEIGVLRSLGARKRDIKNLFNAETFLIGLFAGAIGVGVTYLLSIPINLIFGALTAFPRCGAARMAGNRHDRGEHCAYADQRACSRAVGREKGSRHRAPYRIETEYGILSERG